MLTITFRKKCVQCIGTFAATWALVCAILFTAPVRPAAAQPEGAFLSRFDEQGPLPEGWQISEFTAEASHYKNAWSGEAVSFNPEAGTALELWLRPSQSEASLSFIGAEIQRERRTHFGRYEVEMQAAPGDGVISSFFTYTGPFFGDDHDEIDFEFLGRDTTKVWINRFAKGRRLPGIWLDLGFDAAAGTNLYTFDWQPDSLTWYANGRELHRIEAPDTAIPDIPGRIYINIWVGGPGQRLWSGTPEDGTETMARYTCISYRPVDVDCSPMCSDD